MKCLLFLLGISSYSYGQKAPADSMSVGGIGVVVKDIAKVSQWYQQELGLVLSKEMSFPGYDSLQIHFLKKGTFLLELISKPSVFSIQKYEPDYQPFRDSRLQGFTKIAFRVQDIDAWYKRMQDKKVPILVPIFNDATLNVRSFFVQDPEGNIVQFITALPAR